MPAVIPAPPGAPPPSPPACHAGQLRLSASRDDGAFDGMSHSGVELVIRNRGADCVLAALPRVELRDAGGRTAPAMRRAPPGLHPGPQATPVRLAAGGRAAIDLRWVSGPVYPANRRVAAASVSVRIGRARLTAPLAAVLYGPAGRAVPFDQAPARAMDGAPGR